MAWGFYNKEGKLLYDVVSGSVGDADTLDGVDSTGFVRIGAPGLNIGNADITGSLTLPVTTTAVNLALTDTHRTVLVDSSGAPRTITLPAAPLTGQLYEIRDVGVTGAGSSATNNITINRNGNTIDGVAANLVINQDGAGVVLVFDGTKWVTIADRTIVSVGAIDADTLDTLDSTQFVRSDVADTVAGNITFTSSVYNPVDILNDTTNPNLLTTANRTIGADPATNAAPVTITLPAAPTVGQWYEIVDLNGGAAANNITIDRNGSSINTVAANLVMDTDYDALILVCTSGLNWTVVAWRFPPSGPVAIGLDDLTDVTITGPLEGELLRYNTPANLWVNSPTTTIDDNGQLHLRATGALSGIMLGEALGPGDEVTITHTAPNTVTITGRTAQNGTNNSLITILENGVNPAGDTYDVLIPTDNTLVVNSSAGDVFVRLPNPLNLVNAPMSGDTITIKDGEGFVGTNDVAFVTEGVRRRNVPLLQATSTVGGPVVTISTTTAGGVGVDEEQSFQVTGGTSFKVTFDGQEAAAVLLTASATGANLVTAINSLSPHPNFGHFSVSTTTPAALVSAGVPITFDGGSLIDGEAYYYLPNPWSSVRAVFVSGSGGNWLLI